MPEREIRTWFEGTMAWVQSSGTGLAWNTASAPASGTIGYVQAGFNTQLFDRAYTTIYDRGLPKMHKLTQINPLDMTVNVLYGITADYPVYLATSSGVSTPQFHLEFKQVAPEFAASSGLWWDFLNCVMISQSLTENADGNVAAFAFRALSAVGPTASGRVIA